MSEIEIDINVLGVLVDFAEGDSAKVQYSELLWARRHARTAIAEFNEQEIREAARSAWYDR